MSDEPNSLPVAPSTPSREDATKGTERRAYAPPHLVALGSVRDLTLGKSGKKRDMGTPTQP